MKAPSVAERARVGLLALDLVEAAASAATIESAADLAREMAPLVLEGLTVEEQARVAAALATMAVWGIPRKTPAAEAPQRLRVVNAWAARVRLEWTWLAS